MPPRQLTRNDLETGDVLLFHSEGPLAALIALGGAGDCSHAALWAGCGDNVIEAVPGAGHGSPGEVRETTLAHTAQSRTRVLVHRWKHRDRYPAHLDAVVACARGFKGQPYGITQVLLSAYAVHRELMTAGSAQLPEAVRRQSAHLVVALREAERLPEQLGLTCSELVCRAFTEAPTGPERPPPLRCQPARPPSTRSDTRTSATQQSDASEAELAELCRTLVARQQRLRAAQSTRHDHRADATLHVEDVERWPMFMVSPGDLQHCEDLELVGELSLPVCALMTELVHVPDRRDAEASVTPLPPQADTRDFLAVDACDAVLRGGLLYVAASPAGRSEIRMDREVSAIKRALRRSSLRLSVPVLAATVAETEQAIEEANPTILHFSGHGHTDGLVFVSRDGAVNRLDHDGVRELLNAGSRRLRLLVLDACHTADLARAATPYVDYAIGMQGVISDRDAVLFSEALYETLSANKPLSVAFRRACKELGEQASTPLLFASTQRVTARRRQRLLTSVAAATVVLVLALGSLWGATKQITTKQITAKQTQQPQPAAPAPDVLLPAPVAEATPPRSTKASAKPARPKPRAAASAEYPNLIALKTALLTGKIDRARYDTEVSKLRAARSSARAQASVDHATGKLDESQFDARLRQIDSAYVGRDAVTR